MFKFICSCGDDRDAAQMLQKWDAFNDAGVGTGEGYLGSNAFNSGITPYTQVRAVKRFANTPSNQVLYGFRWWTGEGTFPLSVSYDWYVLTAIHYAGVGAFTTTTKQLSLNILNDGKLELRRGPYSGTVIATTTEQVLFDDTWALIEILATIDSAAGSVTVMVNGVQVLTFSGNTQHLGSAVCDGIEVVPWKIDDVYICDTNTPNNFFIGPRFHVIAKGMAAGYWDEWTPQGDTNLHTIDDATPDGVYNVALGVGLTDLFTPYPVAEEEADEILALQNNLTAYKGSVLSAYKVADVVQIAGIDYVGADLDPPAVSPSDLRTMREFQPSGAPWTRTVYNASKRGYRKTA